MPPIHPMLVHFPIALYFLALLFDAITAFTRKPTFEPAGRIVMVLCAVSALVAVATGELLKSQRQAYLPAHLLQLHQWLGIGFALFVCILLPLRLRKYFRPTAGYLSLAVLGAVLLAAVGDTGGRMAYPNTAQPVAPSTASQTPGNGTNNGLAIAPKTQTNLQQSNTKSAKSPSAVHKSAQVGPQQQSQTGASNNPVVYRAGSTSPDITQIQQMLHQLGYFSHAYTMYYGPVTEQAVRSFQQASGLPTTGNIDEKTLTRLKAQSARRTTAKAATAAKNTTTPRSVSSAKPKPAPAQSTGIDQARYQEGYQLFVSSCQSCHSLQTAEQYYGQLSQSQWQQIVDTMQSYAGGTIPNTDAIVYYLSHHK